MKSSAPLFTKRNPFQPAPKVGKAHYHPSCNQSLSKEKKKTTLSPARSTRRSCPQTSTLNSASPQLSDHRLAAADGQPDFSESWPSTDCGSSPAITATSYDMETAKHSTRAGKSTVSSGVQRDSVLAKYVERFRHGQPQSQEERQQEQLPFWWMSPSSLPPSSTPAKNTDKDQVIQPPREDHVPAIFGPAGQRRRDRSPSPFKGSLSILSDTSHSEFDDTEILHLQERASRLLLRGTEDHESTLSDGYVPVSSDGLGCSDLSSPVSLDESVRRHFNPAKSSPNLVQAVSVIPSLGPHTRPEEDILFQWRLRRKMQQARELPQSLQHSDRHGTITSWQASDLHHPSAGVQAYKQQQSCQPPEFSQKEPRPHINAPQLEAKEALRSFPSSSAPTPSPALVVSGSSVSHHPTLAHVPAHMHLLCDVLPCPIQLSHATAQQNISQRSDEFHTKVVSKKTQAPDNPKDIFTDEPIHEHMSSSTHAPSGAREEKQQPLHNKRTNKKQKAQTKDSDKNEKKTMSIQKQNKSTRYAVDEEHTDGLSSTKRSHSHQRLPKKAMPLAKLQQQGFSIGGCSRDHAPPPSPVHSALGQVVSEVLFPTLDSSPARRSPDSLVSSHCTFSAPPQPPVPPRNTQDSVEVISQLLQEAEDSDEKEFEDDTLLLVLRKQRKWVKQQISEVESMLTEFLDEQQVT
ncbi:putative proline and serine-rich protein 3 isoform 2 [Scophthalmus maximus]|uniref:Putative proline and serine-rich protein 3 n=1 Tax=Scophthalmus maximus TaxID=52904 RepID=A0A2U9AYR3_SCOMX|nr:putative proline and serine-rich protein 3 [Scophthalmus maximus]AWO96804.1 putative proline and serine-rich protein 3 isoform 2 [Scophthalmus maximus]